MAAPDNRKAASIPAVGRGFTVVAGLFNGIKPELAMVVWLNLVLLAVVGFGGMAWLIHRTRYVLVRQLTAAASAGVAGRPVLR